jgi:hypothetical protein
LFFKFFFDISEQGEDGTASLCQVWRDYHREGHEGEILKRTVSQDFLLLVNPSNIFAKFERTLKVLSCLPLAMSSATKGQIRLLFN